jgi:hypothetical protein
MAWARVSFGCAVIAGATALFAIQPSAATVQQRTGNPKHSFETTRTLRLPAGRASRTFTLRERSGVILVNRLTVRRGVRVTASPRSPTSLVQAWPAGPTNAAATHL